MTFVNKLGEEETEPGLLKAPGVASKPPLWRAATDLRTAYPYNIPRSLAPARSTGSLKVRAPLAICYSIPTPPHCEP
jgi:hypothetical protein